MSVTDDGECTYLADDVCITCGDNVTDALRRQWRSTGPHLHFIVKIGGKAVDPMLVR